MPSKLLKRFFVSLTGFFLVCGSAHALTVAPEGPHTVITNAAGENAVYYLASSFTGTVINPAFTKIDFATRPLVFNVAGVDPAQGYFWVVAEDKTTSTTYYPVPITSCNAGVFNSPDGRCVSGTYQSFQISLNLNTICSSTYGSQLRGCSSGTPQVDPTQSVPGLRLRFVSNTGALPGATGKDGYLLALFPEVRPPVATGCAAAPGFFPADQAILVNSNLPTVTPDITTGGSPSFPSYWTFAEIGNSLPTNPFDAKITFGTSPGTGQITVNGFKNSASNSDKTLYKVAYGVQDSAGAVGMCPSISNVFATDIQGFLQESNCFVATASYRDGRAAGVMLLRLFRDQVLVESSAGRSFIGWYYTNGPIAANWLIEHSVFRSVFLSLLIPLQVVAWTALHPSVLFIPLSAFLLLAVFLFGNRRKKTVLLMVALALTGSLTLRPVQSARANQQPYIDSLVSGLAAETYVPQKSGDSPYIDSIRAKAGKNESSEGYTDSLKKEMAPTDGSKNYGENLQKTLPPNNGSAIEDYRNGKKLKPNKGTLETRNAFGFKILASANRTYTAGANQDIAYESVYGNGWVPDFSFHYEYRPFTSDLLKKFGLYSSLGTSFTKAKGRLKFVVPPFDTATESKTQFKFIAVPVNVGLIYRFNLSNFVYPYFGAGPSAIGFIENRNDKVKGQKGHDFGYWYTFGAAFGLDWISPSSSWNQYETGGIKHSYITLDYSRLESLSGGLVDFTVDGVEIGFTFEL